MEILIIFSGVAVPLIIIGLFAMHKERKEKNKEQQTNLQATEGLRG